MLSTLGAEIIKVEDPVLGDYARALPPPIGDNSAFFHVLNRGKRSIVLDLKQAAGRDLLLRLVSRCDVLIEQFRPGVLDRLRLPYEVLREAKPDLILLSLSGYGQTGPLAHKAGHSLNFEALSGFLHLGLQKNGAIPVPAVPVADIVGASAAVSAVLAALFHRQRTGQGQWIDLSITDAVAQMVAPFAAAWTQSSAEERMGPADDALNGGLAVYQVYETQDGGHLAVGALEPKFMVRFAEAAGHPEWLEVPPIPGPHNEGLKASIAAVVASKTVAEWTEILADVDCCVGPVLTPRQAVGHPQFVSRNRVGRAAGGDGAWVECPLGPEPQGEAPSQGQHTQEILREIGLDDAELRELRNAGTIR